VIECVCNKILIQLYFIHGRDEILAELSRNKKAAETQFKKVRLAFEGPKHSSKAKQKRDSSLDDNLDEKKAHVDNDDKATFVPTATKKEYVSATGSNNNILFNIAKNKPHLSFQTGRSRKGQE
jgi:hypothetical protein